MPTPRNLFPKNTLLMLLSLPPEQRTEEFKNFAKPEITPQLLNALASFIDEQRAALGEASDSIAALQAIADKLTIPPMHPAVFAGFGPASLDQRPTENPFEAPPQTARVILNQRITLVGIHPDVDRTQLLNGREVCLNHSQNCIVRTTGLVAPHDSTIGKFERRISASTIEVSHRDEKFLLDCAHGIDPAALKAGDLVVFDRGARMTFEILAPAKPGDAQQLFETPDVPASAVGGNTREMRRLRAHILGAVHNPGLAEKYGLGARRCILLHGPPGNGKTLGVRVIASEFTRSGRRTRVRIVKLHEILDPYVGVAEKNIAELFAAAREAAKEGPVLLFIDELESIGRHRGGQEGHHFDRFLTVFLTELDGFIRSADVCVIGATNRKDLLDAALLSRFSVQIPVRRPDLQTAREIFAVHLHEALPFNPNGSQAPATRTQLIENTTSLLFSPNNPEAQLVRLKFRDSKERIIHARELVSGRLIEGIVEGAKTAAMMREAEKGQPGLQARDIEESVASTLDGLRTTLTVENVRNYIPDLPQDLGIVSCDPLHPKVQRHRHLLRA